MRHKHINNAAVVKVQCGEKIGTAFFVSNSLLLTAQHIVEEAELDKEPIYIYDNNGERKNAVIHYYPPTKGFGDYSILSIVELTQEVYLDCLAMPIQTGDKYSFFGYPYTVLGQSVGLYIDINIHTNSDTIHKIKGFTSSALVCGTFHPTLFTGFSGSPIFNNDSKVIGIVTHKFDGCIGFISINAIAKDLEKNGVSIDNDYENYDQSPYSISTNRELLDRMINNVGPRYTRDLHIDNISLDKHFEYAIEKKTIEEKIKSYKNCINKVCEMIKESSLSVYEVYEEDIKSKLLYDLENYDLGIMHSYTDYLIDEVNNNISNLKQWLINGNQSKDIELWNEFYKQYIELESEIKEHYSLNDKPYLCIFGKAGSGKTHLLCHKAERYIKSANTYLCFGNQFSSDRDIEEQLQQIFGFSNPNFLDELNEKSNEYRTTIIIDALNEGIGHNYWATKLGVFINKLKQFTNICLIISVRDTLLKLFGLSHDWTVVEHIGYDNIKEAKKVYFTHYKISHNEIPFYTPEFRNPLFLKIFCETFNSLDNYKKTRANGLLMLFKHYIKNMELKISHYVNMDSFLFPVQKFILKVSQESVHSKYNKTLLPDITRTRAHDISDKISGPRKWDESLLYWVLEENLFLTNYNYRTSSNTISFAYERMGDLFKALAFMQYNTTERTGILARFLIKRESVRVNNFLVALSAILPDITSDNREIYNEYESQFATSNTMKLAFLESLSYRRISTDKIIDKVENDIFRNINDFTFFHKLISNINNAELIHRILLNLDLSELDIRWTFSINTLFDRNDKQFIFSYSNENIDDICEQGDNEKLSFLTYLSWLLASSYPVIRDRATRVITHILKSNNHLTIKLITKFINVKDLYVLERLFCAIYGVVLKSKDREFIKDIAEFTYENIFKNGNPPLHIHLRQYARLIVERAHYLDLIDSAKYTSSKPMYNSTNNLKAITDEKIKKEIGSSIGTENMLYSTGIIGNGSGIESDFYRYILGGNNIGTTVFSKINKNTSIIQLEDRDMYSVDELASLIANEVYSIGWSNELGELGSNTYSQGRYNNKKERIGKKYQWLALYSVLAKLVDNNYIRDEWSKQIITYDNPASINFGENFDPSIDLYQHDQNIELLLDINPQMIDFSEDDWVNNENISFDATKLIVNGNDGHQWVRISGIETYKDHIDENSRKEIFFIFNTYFIPKNKLRAFNKWARLQNFYGRWMPEINQMTDFCLYEYIWCSTYNYCERNRVTVRNGCPTTVIVSTYNHLQENFNGIDEDNRHNTELPCDDLMIKMNLTLSNTHGLIQNQSNQVVAVDTSYLNDNNKGLYIRKDVLDEYLRITNQSLVMPILGNKELFYGINLLNTNDFTGYYYYNKKAGYIGNVHVVNKEK